MTKILGESSSKILLGAWVLTPSSQHAEVMGEAGLDFQIFDMEHGMFDLGSLVECVRASRLAGSIPFVRVPKVEIGLVQQVLDLGCKGIIFPQIQGAKDAIEAVKCVKRPPEGKRGYNPFTRMAHFSGAKPTSDQDPSVWVIVENKKAYAELDEILSIPGLDGVYLGTYDMSVDLGCPGEMEDPKLQSFVKDGLERIRKSGKFAGAMVIDAGKIESLKDLGANFIVYSVDTFVALNAYKSVKEQVNQLNS